MSMEYRSFGRGKERISVIGFGMGSIHKAANSKEIGSALELALDAGINFFDLARVATAWPPATIKSSHYTQATAPPAVTATPAVPSM